MIVAVVSDLLKFLFYAWLRRVCSNSLSFALPGTIVPGTCTLLGVEPPP